MEICLDKQMAECGQGNASFSSNDYVVFWGGMTQLANYVVLNSRNLPYCLRIWAYTYPPPLSVYLLNGSPYQDILVPLPVSLIGDTLIMSRLQEGC